MNEDGPDVRRNFSKFDDQCVRGAVTKSEQVSCFGPFHPNGEVLLGHVRGGEWLGEMGVIEGRSRNATALAAADGEVEVLTARQFSERVSSELALARDLILRLSIRLRRIEDKLRCRNSNLGKATPTNSTLSTRTTRQWALTR